MAHTLHHPLHTGAMTEEVQVDQQVVSLRGDQVTYGNKSVPVSTKPVMLTQILTEENLDEVGQNWWRKH